MIDYFRRKGWTYKRRDPKAITCAIGGRNCTLDMLIVFSKKCLRFIVRNLGPARNEERIREVCEGLLEINSTLVLGSFSRDIDDGDILFRIGVPVLNGSLTFEQIDHCMQASIVSVDLNYPKIMKLIWSTQPVKEILEDKQVPHTEASGDASSSASRDTVPVARVTILRQLLEHALSSNQVAE